MLYNNINVNYIGRKNTGLKKAAFVILCLFVVFLFTNNHNALFISDYFLPLLAFSIIAIIVILYSRHFVFDFFSATSLLAFLTLCLLSLANIHEIDRGTWLSYIVWFAVLIVVPSIKPDKKSLNLILHSFIIGSLICSLMIFILREQYGATERYTIRFLNNELVDPNYLGCFLYLGFSFSLFYLSRQRSGTNKKKIYLYVVSMLLTIVSIFLTGSRAAYLCSFITFFGFLLRVLKKMPLNKKISLIVGFVVIVVVGILLLSNLLPDSITNRFGLGKLSDESNGLRVQHWIHGLEAFAKRPFGYGAMHTKDILTIYTGHASDCHNTFITFLLHFGIIGFSFLLLLFIKVSIPFFKSKNPFWICFVLAFIANGFIIANHLGVPFWMSIIVMYYLSDKEHINNFVRC